MYDIVRWAWMDTRRIDRIDERSSAAVYGSGWKHIVSPPGPSHYRPPRREPRFPLRPQTLAGCIQSDPAVFLRTL